MILYVLFIKKILHSGSLTNLRVSLKSKLFALVVILFNVAFVSCEKKASVNLSKFDKYSKLLDEIPHFLQYSDTTITIAYFDSLFKKAEPQTNLEQYFNYLAKREIYRLSTKTEDLKKSLAYADSAYELQKSFIPYQPLQDFSCITVKGIIQIKLNNYAEGLQNLFEGKRIASEFLNTCEITRFNEEIAYLFFSQRRYFEAKKYFELILKDREECFTTDQIHFYDKARTLNNIAFCFELLGNIDSAIYHYEQALRFTEEKKTNPNILLDRKLQWDAVIKGNLGYLYFKKGKIKIAESYLRENLTINKINNLDYNDGLLTEIKLAELLISKGELKEANELIEELKKESFITSQLKYQVRLKKVIWLYFDYQDKLKEAYAAYQDWQNTVNLYNQDEIQWRNIDILSDLQVRENKQTLNELKRENLIQTIFLLLLGLIIILAIIITYLIFRNNRNIKKYVIELENNNEELNKSYSDLEKTLDENSRILGIVAHDLRSPLSGISGYATLLLDEKDESTRLLFAETIQTISTNAMQLIEDLLTIDGLSTSMEITEIPIDEIIQYCISLNKFKAQEKNQRILYEPKSFKVKVNPDRFWRVINNLLNNAIKFSPQFSGIIISAENVQNTIRISIQDFGIGIPETMLPDIFTSDKKHRRAGTDGEISHGMGLSICKKIIEAHNGTIRVESEEKKGSTFIVELPLV
jgi:signal transduction histidine kinase